MSNLRFWYLAVPVLLVLLAAGAGLVLWSDLLSREQRLEETWKSALGGSTFPELYPPVATNDTALRLEEIAATLGLGLAPVDRKRNVPSREARDRFDAVEAPLREHIETLRMTVDGTLPELEDDIRTFLAEARPALREAVELLHGGPAPVWERDLGLGLEMPIFNVRDQLNLRRLLALAAVQDARQGREEDALRVLEALWSLDTAARKEPMLIYYLVGIFGHKTTLSVLRGLCSVPPEWQERLDETDLLRELFLVLRADTWITLESGRNGELEQLVEGSGLPPIRPLLRWGTVQTAEVMERSLAEIEKEDLRSFDPNAFFERQIAVVPRWNVVARTLTPNFWDAWAKVRHLELGFELTVRALRAREVLAAGDRSAREELSGTYPSRIEGLSWICEVRSDALTLHLDSGFRTSVKKTLPHEIRLSLAACGGPPPASDKVMP